MKLIEAAKYHCYGNDFIVIESSLCSPDADLAQAVCDPHMGVGADGCLFLEANPDKGFRIRLFNRDGSEAGMSGNGCRTGAAFVRHRGLSEDKELLFETISGQKRYLLLGEGEGVWTFRSWLGKPDFRPQSIPMETPPGLERVIDYELPVADRILRVSAFSVGNPQCQVFLDQPLSEADFQILGAALERHALFPDRANIGFARVESGSCVSLRIWERGVGETCSSGTGSSAAAVAGIVTNRVQSPVEVRTKTGSQIVEWVAGEEIVLTGQANFIADIQYFWEGRPPSEADG